MRACVRACVRADLWWHHLGLRHWLHHGVHRQHWQEPRALHRRDGRPQRDDGGPLATRVAKREREGLLVPDTAAVSTRVPAVHLYCVQSLYRMLCCQRTSVYTRRDNTLTIVHDFVHFALALLALALALLALRTLRTLHTRSIDTPSGSR